jgi:TnpA family transposase
MASVERTAYSRFKRNPSKESLVGLYTPTFEELNWAQRVTRSANHQFCLLVLLKSFQRLGYFPKLTDVPTTIVNHIRNYCNFYISLPLKYDENRTMYRHHTLIREYLQVTAWGKQAKHLAVKTAYDAAQTMNNPADIINSTLEILVKERFELPAFSTLDRLVTHVRALVNRQLFQKILNSLTTVDLSLLDGLLTIDPVLYKSYFNKIKLLPRKPTLTQLQGWISHLQWLDSFVDTKKILANIPYTKIQQFAAEAKTLDVSEMKRSSDAKCYTLIVCLLHQTRIQTRDQLIIMLIKRMSKIQQQGKDDLEKLRIQYKEKTAQLISILANVVTTCDEVEDNSEVGRSVKSLINNYGTSSQILEDCEKVTACHEDKFHPLLWRYFRPYRSTLFTLAKLLTPKSTSQDQSLINALSFMLEKQHVRSVFLPDIIDLSFASAAWQQTVYQKQDGQLQLNRRHFEVCVFVHLAAELKSGDCAIELSSEYADYREQVLSWEQCQSLLEDYCNELNLPNNAEEFVSVLCDRLMDIATTVDSTYSQNSYLFIDKDGKPTLKRLAKNQPSKSATEIENLILDRMPERKIIDILVYVQHYLNWTRHFGPSSGSDPKLDNPKERYILTTFSQGCNLGPYQAARHIKTPTSAHMLSFVNRRHITAKKLDLAIVDIINSYKELSLTKVWGEGNCAAADGTKYDIYEQNLLAEYHIRYGGYGGIAYHHIADNYIALFSHFIPCGVWEAVYIIEGLLKNSSDIKPTSVASDTQGQSTPVFALAHLLGIKLMPRIRNWKDLIFYRPDKKTSFQHIGSIFGQLIDWDLIKTHWQDLMQVVLSIKAGKISSVTLLRKLSNESRKNRLYQAFRELGQVIRTMFLLEYVSNLEMRQQITELTNRMESYNGFSKWLFFGGEGVIAENDPEEQEKRIKYNDLVANAVIFQNVIDISAVLQQLIKEGYKLKVEDVSSISPYLTSHIKRFGDYFIDLSIIPPSLSDAELSLPFQS